MLSEKKHQKHAFKQHKQAFEKISEKLTDNEYVVFSMLADEYMVDTQPGPWHVGVAVTNERLFVCGETISGRVFTYYAMDDFRHDEINFVRLINGNIIISTFRGKIILKGENFELLVQGLEKALI